MDWMLTSILMASLMSNIFSLSFAGRVFSALYDNVSESKKLDVNVKMKALKVVLLIKVGTYTILLLPTILTIYALTLYLN